LTNFPAIAVIIFSIHHIKYYCNGNALKTLINVALLAVIIVIVSFERTSNISHRKHIEQLNPANLKRDCVEKTFLSIY